MSFKGVIKHESSFLYQKNSFNLNKVLKNLEDDELGSNFAAKLIGYG